MFCAVTLQASDPTARLQWMHNRSFFGEDSSRRRRRGHRCSFRPPISRVASKIVQSEFEDVSPTAGTSEPPISFRLISSVGSPPLQPSQWKLNQRHILLLNGIACAAAVSATWLFVAAIPALLAFRRAAESMEKLMDVTREELPGTMAAIRLSGMEISDLTMELSDLGQEITQGVKSSTRAVRIAEDRLRRLTNTTPGGTAAKQD